MNENLESILRRIRKLLAIAKDSRANANEAAAAASQAEKIMRAFQIDHSEVIESELRAGGGAFAEEFVGTTLDPEAFKKQASSWVGPLGVSIADFYDCQARYDWRDGGKALKFSGYGADAAMAKFTYIYLVTTMAYASKHYMALGIYSREEGENFRYGFCKALIHSLKIATAAKKEEMGANERANQLMVVKKSAVEKHFGKVTYGRGGGRSGDGSDHGYAQGSKVDVTRRAISSEGGRGNLLK